MTRLDVIVDAIRRELERRPSVLDGGGLQSLVLHLYFDGDNWTPRRLIMRPEFQSPSEANGRKL